MFDDLETPILDSIDRLPTSGADVAKKLRMDSIRAVSKAALLDKRKLHDLKSTDAIINQKAKLMQTHNATKLMGTGGGPSGNARRQALVVRSDPTAAKTEEDGKRSAIADGTSAQQDESGFNTVERMMWQYKSVSEDAIMERELHRPDILEFQRKLNSQSRRTFRGKTQQEVNRLANELQEELRNRKRVLNSRGVFHPNANAQRVHAEFVGRMYRGINVTDIEATAINEMVADEEREKQARKNALDLAFGTGMGDSTSSATGSKGKSQTTEANKRSSSTTVASSITGTRASDRRSRAGGKGSESRSGRQGDGSSPSKRAGTASGGSGGPGRGVASSLASSRVAGGGGAAGASGQAAVAAAAAVTAGGSSTSGSAGLRKTLEGGSSEQPGPPKPAVPQLVSEWAKYDDEAVDELLKKVHSQVMAQTRDPALSVTGPGGSPQKWREVPTLINAAQEEAMEKYRAGVQTSNSRLAAIHGIRKQTFSAPVIPYGTFKEDFARHAAEEEKQREETRRQETALLKRERLAQSSADAGGSTGLSSSPTKLAAASMLSEARRATMGIPDAGGGTDDTSRGSSRGADGLQRSNTIAVVEPHTAQKTRPPREPDPFGPLRTDATFKAFLRSRVSGSAIGRIITGGTAQVVQEKKKQQVAHVGEGVLTATMSAAVLGVSRSKAADSRGFYNPFVEDRASTETADTATGAGEGTGGVRSGTAPATLSVHNLSSSDESTSDDDDTDDESGTDTPAGASQGSTHHTRSRSRRSGRSSAASLGPDGFNALSRLHGSDGAGSSGSISLRNSRRGGGRLSLSRSRGDGPGSIVDGQVLQARMDRAWNTLLTPTKQRILFLTKYSDPSLASNLAGVVEFWEQSASLVLASEELEAMQKRIQGGELLSNEVIRKAMYQGVLQEYGVWLPPPSALQWDPMLERTDNAFRTQKANEWMSSMARKLDSVMLKHFRRGFDKYAETISYRGQNCLDAALRKNKSTRARARRRRRAKRGAGGAGGAPGRHEHPTDSGAESDDSGFSEDGSWSRGALSRTPGSGSDSETSSVMSAALEEEDEFPN